MFLSHGVGWCVQFTLTTQIPALFQKLDKEWNTAVTEVSGSDNHSRLARQCRDKNINIGTEGVPGSQEYGIIEKTGVFFFKRRFLLLGKRKWVDLPTNLRIIC